MFGAGDHSFGRRCRPSLAQVRCCFGAGKMLFWRRWDTVLAQVRFLAGDLRQRTPSPAPAYPLPAPAHPVICTNVPHHLRQHTPSPAPVCATICSSVLRHLEPLTSSPTPSRPITCANVPLHLHQCTLPPAPSASRSFGGPISAPVPRSFLALISFILLAVGNHVTSFESWVCNFC